MEQTKETPMKTLILAAVAAASTLAAGAAMAQPYGYSYDHRPAYGYSYDRGYVRFADRDRDGIPDRYDRYDNRRDRWAWERRHRHYHHDWRYDRYDRRW
jgi:hypothetical protein